MRVPCLAKCISYGRVALIFISKLGYLGPKLPKFISQTAQDKLLLQSLCLYFNHLGFLLHTLVDLIDILNLFKEIWVDILQLRAV